MIRPLWFSYWFIQNGWKEKGRSHALIPSLSKELVLSYMITLPSPFSSLKDSQTCRFSALADATRAHKSVRYGLVCKARGESITVLGQFCCHVLSLASKIWYAQNRSCVSKPLQGQCFSNMYLFIYLFINIYELKCENRTFCFTMAYIGAKCSSTGLFFSLFFLQHNVVSFLSSLASHTVPASLPEDGRGLIASPSVAASLCHRAVHCLRTPPITAHATFITLCTLCVRELQE